MCDRKRLNELRNQKWNAGGSASENAIVVSAYWASEANLCKNVEEVIPSKKEKFDKIYLINHVNHLELFKNLYHTLGIEFEEVNEEELVRITLEYLTEYSLQYEDTPHQGMIEIFKANALTRQKK